MNANDTLDIDQAIPPSALELATLASGLARTGKENPEDLARRAIFLWVRCHEERRVFLRNMDPEWIDTLRAELDIPTPKKYPITYDEFMMAMLPHLKGRTADRAAIFREYIGDTLDWGNPVTKDAVDASFAEHRSRPINKETQFVEAGVFFRRWYKDNHDFKIREARRLAQRASIAKRKRRARPPVKKLAAILKEQKIVS